MAPRLPVLSGRDVVRALAKAGFHPVGQRGSHVRLKDSNRRLVIVPNHAAVDVGTLKSIIRQAGLDREGFLRLL